MAWPSLKRLVMAARKTAPKWLLGTAALVALSIAGREAESTTFVLMDEGELASRSVAVITGTVRSVQAAGDEQTGGVNSYITIEPESVLAGAVPAGEVVLRETGGRLPDREELVYGAPVYVAGEKVVAFLSRNEDGSLRTTAMAMGKYRLGSNDAASLNVRRTFGSGVTVLRRTDRAATGDTSRLDDVIARIHAAPAVEEDAYSAPIHWQPTELDRIKNEYSGSFSYLGNPARWFEPDAALPVLFDIDPSGDPKIGPEASYSAILQALNAWTAISTSQLHLAAGELTAPQPFAGCGGRNRIVFNDPSNEITDPTNCGGILAIGGYCASWETGESNGTTFRKIAVGKVTLNNGWDKCAGWNGCNLAEVITHELGHAIGLGHSESGGATMSPSAHFDGRCANVASDDIEGAESLYGDLDRPTATASPTPTPTTHMLAVPSSTSTVQATRTATRPRTATVARTATPTRTRTTVRTKTATRVRTATRTRTPSIARTATKTRTPIRTRTATRTKTPTRTRTSTRVRTPTATPQIDSGAVSLPSAGAPTQAWWLSQYLPSWSGSQR